MSIGNLSSRQGKRENLKRDHLLLQRPSRSPKLAAFFVWYDWRSVDAIDEEIKAYYKWIKAYLMERCYILAKITNFFQHHHQSMTSTYDMLKSM